MIEYRREDHVFANGAPVCGLTPELATVLRCLPGHALGTSASSHAHLWPERVVESRPHRFIVRTTIRFRRRKKDGARREVSRAVARFCVYCQRAENERKIIEEAARLAKSVNILTYRRATEVIRFAPIVIRRSVAPGRTH
jgi:hypothetical protein